MVRPLINTPVQIQKLEAQLEQLRARLPDLPVPAVLLSRLLQHLGRGMASLFEQQIRPFGLVEAEFRVLTTLFSQPDGIAHPSELSARTSQSPANMSRISDALVSRDFITRVSSVQDRRKMVLRITEQGEELVRRALPTLLAPLHEMFEEFTEEELRHLVGQLKRLSSKLDAAFARHGPERGA
jgi:DNA-binding MarR family transcriptional regulator